MDTMICRTLSIALFACGAAFAQLESAIITGATAPAAAKAGQTAAKGIRSTMGRAGNALGSRGRRIVIIRARAHCGRQRAPGERSRGEPNVSDAKPDFNSDDVKVGMTRDELMAVTGKPYLKITIPIEGGSSERLTYQMKDGGLLRIVLELEKVTDIKPLETAR